ncbi:hypothetical protein O6P43_031762 [Quillaja saponaria]|uniref:Uncharacterized protein n=1 Tax=Quillaja saponaria TaxID=32244 RepID=A0AAD7KW39_QUISA|nr:hypothetical protein O6P43_031762 [Quillaja saponaria]
MALYSMNAAIKEIRELTCTKPSLGIVQHPTATKEKWFNMNIFFGRMLGMDLSGHLAFLKFYSRTIVRKQQKDIKNDGF